LSLLTLNSCASSHRSSQPPAQTEIRVPLNASPVEALRLTRATFEAQGFEIERGFKGDSVVTTVPKYISRGLLATYRAFIQPVDSGVVVRLSGSVFNETEAARDWALFGMGRLRDQPLTNRMRAESSFAWTRLQGIADRLGTREKSQPDST
jgi:hypothetical protein